MFLGKFWTILGKFGQVQTSLDEFGQVWTSLDEFGRVWTSKDKANWAKMGQADQAEPSWANLGPVFF